MQDHGTTIFPSVSQPARSGSAAALAKRSGRPPLSGFGMPMSNLISPGASFVLSPAPPGLTSARSPFAPRDSVLTSPIDEVFVRTFGAAVHFLDLKHDVEAALAAAGRLG